MEIEFKDKMIQQIINKQFEIAGYNNVTFEGIPEEGIKSGKKFINWFDYYKYKNEDQYLEWKNWAISLLKEKGHKWNTIDEIDMLYGLQWEYKENKKELLF